MATNRIVMRCPDLQEEIDAEGLPDAVIAVAEHTLKTVRPKRTASATPGPLFTTPFDPVPPVDPDAFYLGVIVVHVRGWNVRVLTYEHSPTKSEIVSFHVVERP